MDSSVQVPRVISLARLLENWSFYACVISGVVQRGRRKLSAQRAQLNWLCRWEASARLSLCRHSAARRSKQAAAPTRVAERKVKFFFLRISFQLSTAANIRAISMKFLNGSLLLVSIIHVGTKVFLFIRIFPQRETIALVPYRRTNRKQFRYERRISPLESCRIGNWNSAAHQVPAGKSSFLFRRVTYPTLSNTRVIRGKILAGKHRGERMGNESRRIDEWKRRNPE